MKKITIYIIFSIILFNPVYGQKYKDIFLILNDKNYEQGEPMLRSFLLGSKNEDHPNGNFQMAMLLETKIENLNIIDDSTKIIRYCDSIELFYNKAKTFITEKELKKRDEFYKNYYRRDLRTGEFTIKKSDIDGDIEKKIVYYDEVKSGAKFLAVKLPALEKSMRLSKELYAGLTEGFSSKSGFALSLNKELLEALDNLKEQNNTSVSLVSTIQNKIASLPDLGFNSDEEILPVTNIETDGKELKNVFEGKFKLWDYASFSDEIRKLYESEVITYRELLINENEKFKQMLKVLTQSIIPPESPNLSEQLLNKTADIDAENIAISILKYKSELIKYKLVDLNVIEDATHIYRLLDKYDTLNKIVTNASMHFNKFSELNTPIERKKYNAFLTSDLGRATLIDQYVEDQKIWVENRVYFIGKKTAELTEAIRWGINGDDSVAVFTEEEGQLASRITTYIDSDTTNYFVIGGFDIQEAPYKAFVSRLDDGMRILWKYDIQTKQEISDSLRNDNIIFKMIPGRNEFITLYFTEDGKEYRFFAIDKKSGDVKWKTKVIPKKPIFDVKYNDLTKETVIYLDNPEDLEEGKDVAYLVIDKFGKVRK